MKHDRTDADPILKLLFALPEDIPTPRLTVNNCYYFDLHFEGSHYDENIYVSVIDKDPSFEDYCGEWDGKEATRHDYLRKKYGGIYEINISRGHTPEYQEDVKRFVFDGDNIPSDFLEILRKHYQKTGVSSHDT